MTDLTSSFYKSNVLRFINLSLHTDLNSTIEQLYLYKLENVDIDTSLVNPYVFARLTQLWLLGGIRTIEPNLMRSLENLASITMNSIHFRKLIHNGGIEWMRQINSHIRVDLNNMDELVKHVKDRVVKYVKLFSSSFFYHESNIRVFPEHDFCIYKDFPFEQLVFIIHLGIRLSNEYSCSYLWLLHHADKFAPLLKSPEIYLNLKNLLNSTAYKSISRCDFSTRLKLCDSSNFRIKEIWGLMDYRVLSKKLILAIKILTYLVTTLGIVTNSILILAMISNQNADLFKNYKHYTYLCLIAVFSEIILAIQLSGWFTECTYPYEVFCPSTRKLVFFQFFKLIFKECLSNALKFMCNFAYIAFALNRISLIGKDHGKLVKWVSEIRVRVYLCITIAISVALSVIKCFKYRINYGHPESEYPISNELDMNQFIQDRRLFAVLFIFQSVSDLINFVVFILINFAIDMFMAVRMRNTLKEKCKRLAKAILIVNELMHIESNSKKKENDDAINKVNKFVILNTLIGILLKLPMSFLSIVNVCAEFYYRNYSNTFMRPAFGEFYTFLQLTGLNFLLNDLANLLFIISLSIQLFIYIYFDKKVKISIERLRNNNDNVQKEIQNSSKCILK